jgi:hypothetical protein
VNQGKWLAALLSFSGIIFGAMLVLAGLLMIAPQVRVHQIRIYSVGSWMYRAGIALSLIGLIVLPLSDGLDALAQVGLVTGVAGLMGGTRRATREKSPGTGRTR